ncbi:MAG TPA: glycosyltransferase family 4 protein [Pyrinomonadaceae bacterium]|nr:glycosyltransferase family 4 protein [Pyrinomonadaceae bacterium]
MDRIESRVLFISYNGMLDPLGQSQVLPYLRVLAAQGIRFTLLSFERPPAFTAEGKARRNKLKLEIASENIQWHALPYHQTPSLPATAYDVLQGIRVARHLIDQNQIELVHARSHIPATIALGLKKLCGVKMIFDVRGLMAEEYVEANHWRKESLAYRVTKFIERRALAAADGVVTLTERIWPVIREWDGLRGRNVVHEVVPCCADLEKFCFRVDDRNKRRAELNLEGRLTIVYSGSIGGWYLTREMADFFLEVLRQRPDAHFLWLTAGHPELIERIMSDKGIEGTSYTVMNVQSADMPSYLSAADAGIAFYKPGPSKLATSPVKVTEYLACGLPVILNEGVGDSDAILNHSRAGVLVSKFESSEYARAWNEMECLIADEDTRERARELAQSRFDLHGVGAARYRRLYARVFASNEPPGTRSS